ncbi:MAG: STAS-like domain-containing protein [Thiohalomonadales bacterium]
MGQVIPLSNRSESHFLGTRFSACDLRQELEDALIEHEQVTLDFDSTFVTQSFIDELLGVLILKHSPEFLNKIVFKNCSPDAKAILQLVVSTRSNDYRKKYHH